MNAKKLPVAIALFISLLLSPLTPAFAVEPSPVKPKRIRIGVDIRLRYQSCLDSWLPVAEYLTKAIPGYQFVVVPLASQQDVAQSLERNEVDFVALDPAMEIMAHDRYNATPLVTMAENGPESPQTRVFHAACSGTLIRRADRMDIRGIQDIRGKRLAATKPWSLTGWIAEWGLLVKNGIDPQKDLKQVAFVGTHGQVVRDVLEGTADVGAVDSDMLIHLVRSKQINAKDIYFINRKGVAVPLAVDADIASTDVYPGRVLSKTEATSDELARRVADALLKQSVIVTFDNIPYRMSFGVACNYSKVRQLLQKLMGPHYAESVGFPLPAQRPAWLFPASLAVGWLALFLVALFLLHKRYSRRDKILSEQLEETRLQLLEVRAEKQRIDTILALAGCGIDIIDNDSGIVYADAGLERNYGNWHGRKCHDYYCGSDKPCANCHRGSPEDDHGVRIRDIDGSKPPPTDDPHARVHYVEGKATRMIEIPFHDETGRWLYARIHFPTDAFLGKNAGC
jgi:ABC-type phosphate/phosphonate transport system substrate-binding protein